MTDYPTRAEIDAARGTLARLRSHTGGQLTHTLVWSALSDTLAILDALDDVPGLHYPDAEPEPEPKTSAAEVLEAAWVKADDGSAHESILYAALRYAQTAPAWFADWHAYDWPSTALIAAATEAQRAGDETADLLLNAAHWVADQHPDLFGGAA